MDFCDQLNLDAILEPVKALTVAYPTRDKKAPGILAAPRRAAELEI